METAEFPPEFQPQIMIYDHYASERDILDNKRLNFMFVCANHHLCFDASAFCFTNFSSRFAEISYKYPSMCMRRSPFDGNFEIETLYTKCVHFASRHIYMNNEWQSMWAKAAIVEDCLVAWGVVNELPSQFFGAFHVLRAVACRLCACNARVTSSVGLNTMHDALAEQFVVEEGVWSKLMH
jgi:hypothetical protein